MSVFSQDTDQLMVPYSRMQGLIRYVPVLAASIYPFLLRAFHFLVGPPASHVTTPQLMGAAVFLMAAFLVPMLGMACAMIPRQEVGTRRLAYASVAAPTLYVFLGVVQTLAGSPIPDELVWVLLWFGAGVWLATTRPAARAETQNPDLGRWRVAHGIAGSIVLIYVLFHIANHLFGLLGPEAHAVVMDIGRHVYRAPIIEPLLMLAFLFQVASGLYLAWRWSTVDVDFYRLMQLASGVYLSVFVLGHMNSVFIYARAYLEIPTDWAFATGAPTGIIHDAWNIRLLPHYTLGVFFVMTHLASGLRGVLIAHGTARSTANRLWAAGTVASAAIAILIIAGMCGLRV